MCTTIYFHLALPLFENVVFSCFFFQLSAGDEENGWVHGDEGDEDMTDGKHSFCISAAGFLPNLEHNIYVFFLAFRKRCRVFRCQPNRSN